MIDQLLGPIIGQQLLCLQHQGRHSPVVANGIHDVGPSHGLSHLPTLLQVESHWLLTEDVLAGDRSPHAETGVTVMPCDDEYGVHILVRQDHVCICRRVSGPRFRARCFRRGQVEIA